MKKIILFIFLLTTTTSLFAEKVDTLVTDTTVVATLSAEKITKLQADSAYIKENYQAAVNCYEALLQKGEAAAIYYNLGNSYFKLDQLGKAILNYERAALLHPSDEDIQFNLAMARSKTVDKLKPSNLGFFTSMWQGVRNVLSSSAWAHLAVAFFLIMLSGIAIYAFSKRLFLRKLSFYAAIVFLFFTIISNMMSSQQKKKRIEQNYAIVLVPNITAHSTPDESGTALFLLHEGHKVMIKDASMEAWVEVAIEDGNTGWVPVSAIEKI